MMMKRLALAAVSVVALAAQERAEAATPARVFTDNMVLQADRAIPVWGVGTPGEKVTVSFAGATASATVDAKGDWQATLAAQRPLCEALAIMESRGKFCHPLVDWQGSLHWAESWLCPAFAHVTEDDATIAEKAHTWRPCGLCAGYRKLLANNEPKYLLAKLILGVSL